MDRLIDVLVVMAWTGCVLAVVLTTYLMYEVHKIVKEHKEPEYRFHERLTREFEDKWRENRAKRFKP